MKSNQMASAKQVSAGVPMWLVPIGILLSITISFRAGEMAQNKFLAYLGTADDVAVRSSIAWIVNDLEASHSPKIDDNDKDDSTDEDEDDDDDDVDEDEDDDEEKEDKQDVSTSASIQELFLDMKGVPETLINSEDSLEELLEEVAEELDTDFSVLGCHESGASIISCLAILKDRGHVALHAMPKLGSVFLEIVTLCSGMLDIIDDLRDIFKCETDYKWSLRPRVGKGFESDLEAERSDYGTNKTTVASLRTAFQQVDILDFFTPDELVNIADAQMRDPEYYKANPHLFQPDRALYLDGVIQSSQDGDASYHEALVHPSMFAHPNPRRVAIIGGGECATLREVLKHNTVQEAVMIEIDPGVVDASKNFLIQWNDCSNLAGSSRYCMDDPRSKIYNEDAFAWFMDRYLKETIEHEKFDVIIMDALDPQNVVEFAKALYGDNSFLAALYAALSENGILITQVGDAPERDDPPEQLSLNENRIIYANSLAKQGFEFVADYTEDHTGFEAPWYFYAAFKDSRMRVNWMASEAEINREIHRRAVRTLDGTSPFHFFDGAMMKQYQYPSRASVELFCLREPTPTGCDQVLSTDTDRFMINPFEVNASTGAILNRTSTWSVDVDPVRIEAPSLSLIEKMDVLPHYNGASLTLAASEKSRLPSSDELLTSVQQISNATEVFNPALTRSGIRNTEIALAFDPAIGVHDVYGRPFGEFDFSYKFIEISVMGEVSRTGF